MDPPTGDQTAEEGGEAPSKRPKSRTYRVEKFYGVDSGKWYYEAEILTEGPTKLGWTLSACSPDFELGGDDVSLNLQKSNIFFFAFRGNQNMRKNGMCTFEFMHK